MTMEETERAKSFLPDSGDEHGDARYEHAVLPPNLGGLNPGTSELIRNSKRKGRKSPPSKPRFKRFSNQAFGIRHKAKNIPHRMGGLDGDGSHQINVSNRRPISNSR